MDKSDSAADTGGGSAGPGAAGAGAAGRRLRLVRSSGPLNAPPSPARTTTMSAQRDEPTEVAGVVSATGTGLAWVVE
jgi:hypothetical protein